MGTTSRTRTLLVHGALLASALWPLPAAAGPDPVGQTMPDFPTIRHIVGARCRFCHTGIAQEDGLNAASQPPKGIKFDTMADWRKFAPLMLDAAVTSKRMPPGNATHMTDAERTTLGTWLAAGAPVPEN